MDGPGFIQLVLAQKAQFCKKYDWANLIESGSSFGLGLGLLGLDLCAPLI